MATQLPTRFAHTILPLAGLVLLALGLLCAAYRLMAPGAVALEVGPADRRFVYETHELEQFGAQPVRWTNRASYLLLPPPAAGQPLLLRLTLLNSRPADYADPTLDLTLEGERFSRFAIIRKIDGKRHYQVLLPPQNPAGWSLRLGLGSDTVRPAADPRDLGFVLMSARLSPLGSRPLLPPWWQLGAFLVLAVTGCLALRGLGLAGLLAASLTALALVLLALGVARAPLQFLPFLPRLAALTTLAAAYGLAVHLLARPARDGAAWARTAHGPAAGQAGLVLPVVLLMGAAYWLMPVYQLVMTADGVRGVRPGVPTMVIGGVGLLLIALGLPLVRRPRATLGPLVASLLPVAVLGLLVWWVDGGTLDAGWPGLPAWLQILVWAPLAAGSSWALYRQGALLGEEMGWRRLVACVLAVSALGHLAYMVGFAFTRSGPDFWILYKATRDWAVRGEPLYNLAGIELNHFGHTFKVPPFYGMLFLPWVRTDGELVLLGHRILNTSLAAATLAAWFWHGRLRPTSALGLGLLMLYNMRPLADTIAFGQIDIVLLALLVAALIASQRSHDLLAGLALALATLFKLYPAVLLAFFVVKGQWRALAGFLLGMLVFNGLAIGLMGWEAHRIYLFEVLPRIGGGTAWVENQTLNGFLSRLAGGEMASNKYDNPLVALVTYGGFVLATAGFSLLALQPAERRQTRYALQFAQFAILMVLFVPAAWIHYATITLVAFVGVLLALAERGARPWQAALFGLAYGLLAYGNQWSFFGGVVYGPLTLLGVSYKFYGLVLLTVVLVSVLLAEPVRAWRPAWLPRTRRARLATH
jgi:hypothetical protein